MSKDIAIANCRVSSDEQLQNNSLTRQKQSVLQAAERLNVIIPDDGWWEGSVSSKKGGNLNRKDIQEMLEYCQKHKNVKYLIVDEPDRFMRSIDEAFYFEQRFRLLGVKIFFASEEALNENNLQAKLQKFMKYFVAEGSNDERQSKSIRGQVQAINEGRYPFRPKLGYKKSLNNGVHDLDEPMSTVLKDLLKRIAAQLISPTQALKELNKSEFIHTHSPYKMDKFARIITDPYYAGILVMDKQVKARNEYGLHQPLISVDEHKKIVDIVSSRKNKLKPVRKDSNKDFPLDNILFCDNCMESSSINKFVGFNHTNGVTDKIYKRYRCRSKGCGRYLHAEEVHESISQIFNAIKITDKGTELLKDALESVWKSNETNNMREVSRSRLKIKNLKSLVQNQIEALSDPANASLRDEIRYSIDSKKLEISQLEDFIEKTSSKSTSDQMKFIDFALAYTNNLSQNFFNLPRDKQLLCKQLLFPAGFRVDKNKKVYTDQISELYRLAINKEDPSRNEESSLVDFYNQVRTELECEG